MTPERWARIDTLYHAVLELPPDQRELFLRQACQGDPELLSEVMSLLEADEAGVAFLDRAPQPATTQLVTPVRSIRTLGPYEIEAEIGSGGMGTVFRARDTRLHRTVAIKVLSSELSGRFPSHSHLQRFLAEARAVSALNHPNIVILYDIANFEGIDFLVLEYVHGTTLAQLIKAQGLPFDDVCRYGIQTAKALAAAHEAGIVHRDIKPANIMVTPQLNVKVLDFGIAKRRRLPHEDIPPSVTTIAGNVLGTISYMSPEQARGDELDGRSDVFSLGAVLYEAATGRLPFTGSSAFGVLHAIATTNPPAPSTLVPHLPPQFDEVVNRALAKECDRRYQSAADLATALEELSRPSTPLVRQAKTASSPFVGRDKERRRLAALLEHARAGSGKLALLTGEPGIGKSALVRAFVEDAAGSAAEVLVGRGACVEQHSAGEAYLPFLQALQGLITGQRRERVLSVFRRDAPSWCLQFSSLFTNTTVDQFQRDTIGITRERMLRELGDAVGELAASFPVLLVIEDLHWADTPTIDLIRYLAGRSTSQRLLLVGTTRPGENEPAHRLLRNCIRELVAQSACEEFALDSLEEQEVTQYLNLQFSPSMLPPELAGLIFRKTEGHPLFVTGVLQLLTERGEVVRRNGHWVLARPAGEIDLSVPESVRGMIARKLEALDERERRMLQFASVQGISFFAPVLAGALGWNELDLEESLNAVQSAHRLIVGTGDEEMPSGVLAAGYRFAHALYRDAFYDEVLPKRRIALHQQAAEALASLYTPHTAKVAGVLGMHFERARNFPRAVEFLAQAGENATAVFVHTQAGELYSHALELAEKIPGAEQTSWRLLLHKRRGDSCLIRGASHDALSDYQAALRIAEAHQDEEWRCRALIDLANVHMYTRQVDDIATAAGRAIEVADRIGQKTLWCEAMGQLAASRQVVGRLAEAHQLYGNSIQVARELRHIPALLQTLTYQGVAYFFSTEYKASVAVETEALALAAEARNPFYLGLARTYLGFSLANQGELSAAIRSLTGAIELAKRNNNQIVLARAPNGMGWIHRELGSLRSAAEYDQASLETARRVRATEAEANALINLIQSHTVRGEHSHAGEAMRRVDSLFDRETWNRWRFYDIRYPAVCAEFWLTQRKVDTAYEYADRLLANAQRYGVPKYAGIAFRLLGEIHLLAGAAGNAEECLRRSVEIFGSAHAPLAEWKSHAALGRLLRSAGGRDAAAREAFAQAARVIHELAASIEEEELRECFLNLSEVGEVTEGARTGGTVYPG